MTSTILERNPRDDLRINRSGDKMLTKSKQKHKKGIDNDNDWCIEKC